MDYTCNFFDVAKWLSVEVEMGKMIKIVVILEIRPRICDNTKLIRIK